MEAITAGDGDAGDGASAAVADYCAGSWRCPTPASPCRFIDIVFDERKEKNPCSLCAKLRRGSLHTALGELGISKIALGHHFDDAVETMLMNLLFEGRIGCFQPVTYLDRSGHHPDTPPALLPRGRGAPGGGAAETAGGAEYRAPPTAPPGGRR
ncbi:MAG: hypothetical protein ACLUNQ_09630 [Oscillospiraceae bacterium]